MTGLNAKPTPGARNHECVMCSSKALYFFDDGRGWRCGNHWKWQAKTKFKDKQETLN